MSYTIHALASLAAIATVGAYSAANDTISQPFMLVERLAYADGQIVFERTIGKPKEALATVTVAEDFNGGFVVCSGASINTYTTREEAVKTGSLAWFSFDPLCDERVDLTRGGYTVFARWAPLDGSETVSANLEIPKATE